MANNLVSNPIVIDTFGSDINIGKVTVSSISLVSAAAGDDAIFIDENGAGVVNVHIAQNVSGGFSDWMPSVPFHFRNGLIYDESASNGIAAGDRILIYLA